MAVDTFMAYVGVYAASPMPRPTTRPSRTCTPSVGLIDAYDAAVIERREDGKVKITKKHETPTRVGGVLGGGVGLATGLVVGPVPVRRHRRRPAARRDRRWGAARRRWPATPPPA